MKANNKVKPYKGVKVGNGGKFTKYSVSQSKKQPDGTWKKVGWINVMVAGGKEIPDGNPDKAELMIENIQGIDLDEYNGKMSVTVWADGYVEGAPEDTLSGFSQVEDDCPF